MTAIPSNNWIAEEPILDPFGSKLRISEHEAKLSEARRMVRHARNDLCKAKTSDEREFASKELEDALVELAIIEYNAPEVAP